MKKIVQNRDLSLDIKRYVNVKDICKKKGYYICGFVEGEGSFNTSFRQRNDFITGWKITPVLNVTQKERTVLDMIKNTLGCGAIRFRSDNAWVYEVTSKEDIFGTVIPFFERFVLLSHSKRVDFDIFKSISCLLRDNPIQNTDLVRKICEEIERKVHGSNRKYSVDVIMKRCLEVSQARCSALLNKKKEKQSKKEATLAQLLEL